MQVIRRHQPDPERQLEALRLLLCAALQDSHEGTAEEASALHDSLDRERKREGVDGNRGTAE